MRGKTSTGGLFCGPPFIYLHAGGRVYLAHSDVDGVSKDLPAPYVAPVAPIAFGSGPRRSARHLCALRDPRGIVAYRADTRKPHVFVEKSEDLVMGNARWVFCLARKYKR